MKFIAVPAIIMIGLLLLVCDNSETAGMHSTNSRNDRSVVTQETPKNAPTRKPFDITSYKKRTPLVWVGRITVKRNIEITQSDFYWSLATDDSENNTSDIKTNEYVTVDLMNCGGYLGRAILSKDATDDSSRIPSWKTEQTVFAADASQKLSQCDTTPGSEFMVSGAFAVAPIEDKRKSIVIGKADTQKVFRTLPKDVTDWRNSKVNIETWKYPKSDLTISNDIWTDLDGDGSIDLIDIFGCHDEEHCSDILLMRLDGKWKNVGGVEPK